jgi:2-keto-4-pentenoate hydratase/2-oxohepta-3-ene-1,7-dioic acid hydratase in catechol pathway
MRLVSFRSEGDWRVGVEQDGLVCDVTGPDQPCDLSPVRALLVAGPAVLNAAIAQAQHAFEARDPGLLALDALELGPPVPDPDKIVCVGLNYVEHAAEASLQVPTVPVLFAKFRNSLVGPQGEIVLPGFSTAIDYEGELAVVIGTRCKDAGEAEALSYVGGYAAFNDVSARDIQMQTSQWIAGKAIDTFAPMGPGIMPAAEIPDPQTLALTTRVNGMTLQKGHTSEMIFSVARLIAHISSLMTLEPGDIIATGTPSGVGFKRVPPVFLKEGDLVEVEIERVGLIQNRVVVHNGKADEDVHDH